MGLKINLTIHLVNIVRNGTIDSKNDILALIDKIFAMSLFSKRDNKIMSYCWISETLTKM